MPELIIALVHATMRPLPIRATVRASSRPDQAQRRPADVARAGACTPATLTAFFRVYNVFLGRRGAFLQGTYKVDAGRPPVYRRRPLVHRA